MARQQQWRSLRKSHVWTDNQTSELLLNIAQMPSDAFRPQRSGRVEAHSSGQRLKVRRVTLKLALFWLWLPFMW